MHGRCEVLPNPHEPMQNSARESVRGDVRANGVESFRSMLKRAHKGTFHKMSPQHSRRYVNELAGRHSIRDPDSIDRMESIAGGMPGKRPRYCELAGSETA